MILALIAACEVAFWVVLVAALLVRYVLRADRISRILLWLLPVVDLVLLVAIAADLLSGAAPHSSHGLGALYLGFTVMFVHPMTTTVDAWFARHFDAAPPVKAAPRYGMARARHEWRQLGRAVLACGISAVLLEGMVLITPEGSDTAPLTQWFASMGYLLVIWGVIAASYTVFPKKDPARKQTTSVT